MADNKKEYLLGSSEREIERLAYQNEVWFDATNELWEKAEIGLGNWVVDLGCGPGFCTFPLSRLVGSKGHIFAIDSSDKFSKIIQNKIQSNNTKNVSFQKSYASYLDIADNSVDAVFSRWLFCFLENPEKVIKEINRILKPNGKLIIIDYFNYLSANIFPKNDILSLLFAGYLENVVNNKGSYNIGEELPTLLVKNSFTIELLIPICRIAQPNTRLWNWVELFNEVSIPNLVKEGIWSKEQKEEFESEWKKAKNNPASFFFTPPMIGIIAKTCST